MASSNMINVKSKGFYRFEFLSIYEKGIRDCICYCSDCDCCGNFDIC